MNIKDIRCKHDTKKIVKGNIFGIRFDFYLVLCNYHIQSDCWSLIQSFYCDF